MSKHSVNSDIRKMTRKELEEALGAFWSLVDDLIKERQEGNVNEFCGPVTENRLIHLRFPYLDPNSFYNPKTGEVLTHQEFRNNCELYGTALCRKHLLVCDEKHPVLGQNQSGRSD